MALIAFPGPCPGAGPVRDRVLPLLVPLSFSLQLRPLAAFTWSAGSGSCPDGFPAQLLPLAPCRFRGSLACLQPIYTDSGGR